MNANFRWNAQKDALDWDRIYKITIETQPNTK